MESAVEGFVRTLGRLAGDIGGTEARLGVTVALVGTALVVAAVVAPYLVRAGAETARRVAERRGDPDSVADAGAAVPWGLLVVGVVRALQAALVFLAVLAALIVWGQLGLAVSLGAVAAGAAPVGIQVLATLAVGLVAYAGAEILEDRLADYAAEADYLSQHQEGIVFRVLQLSIIAATVLAVLFIWQVNPTGLLVGAGFLGIVVGMAARQTLGSVIAGFVLMFSRPMELGDWVEIDEREGIVTDITIVNTRLRNFDGETVVIPNDRVSNSTVVNRSRQGQLRVRVDVGIDYGADIEEARALAREAMAGVEEVADNPSPQVVPTGFGDSAVSLQCRFWISRPNVGWLVRARSNVVREVKAAFDDAGVAIPYPQRQLSSREGFAREAVREPVAAERGDDD